MCESANIDGVKSVKDLVTDINEVMNSDLMPDDPNYQKQHSYIELEHFWDLASAADKSEHEPGTEVKPCSFLQFMSAIRMLDAGINHNLVEHPTLGFVPGMVPRMPGLPPMVTPIPSDAAGVISDVAGRVTGDLIRRGAAKISRGRGMSMMAEAMAQRADDFIAEGINRIASGASIPTDDGDGGTSSEGYSGGTPYNPTGISLASEPVDVKFETGIRVSTFEKYFKNGTNDTSPLIIKQATLNLFHIGDDKFSDVDVCDFFEGPMMTFIRNELRSRARWDNTMGTLLQTDKVKEYLNKLSYALSIYYFCQNILSYQLIPSNRNAGMESLYNSFNAEDLNQIRSLGLELEKSLIPPTLNETLHAMYAPYKQSHLPGSPLFINMPWFFETVGITTPFSELGSYTFGTGPTAQTLGPVATARRMLRTGVMIEMQGLLARTNDTWNLPKIRGYSGMPLIDPNMTTHFTNSAYWTSNTVSGNPKEIFLPTMKGPNDTWRYNYHTDAPDGWTEAFQMIQVSTLNQHHYGPGMWGPLWYPYASNPVTYNNQAIKLVSSYSSGDPAAPVPGYTTSCVIYAVGPSMGTYSKGFWPIEISNRAQSISGNTYTTLEYVGFHHSAQKFGTASADNATQLGFRYSVQQMLQWLYIKDFSNGKMTFIPDKGGSLDGNLSMGRNRRGNRRGRSNSADEPERT